MVQIKRPDPSEHDPYYGRYMDLVPEGDLLQILAEQGNEAARTLRGLGEALGGFRYAPDKWTVKELVGHCLDTERIFAARALWFAREAAGEFPGMDQDPWVVAGRFGARTLADLVTEYRTVRVATLTLLGGLDEAALIRPGKADGKLLNARSCAFVIVGHERHHLTVLDERYR